MISAPQPYLLDLKAIRVASGISQSELDDLVGVADGYTAKIESGARTLSLNMLGFYAEAVDADVRIIQREDDDMSQGGRKPRARNGRAMKEKGSRIELEIVHRLRDAGIEAERIVLSGAAGRFHSRLEHDVRVSDTFQCEVKARANGEGFLLLEQWLGTAAMLFLRRDRQDPFVFIPWETFEKLITAFERERTGQCQPTAGATASSSSSSSTAETAPASTASASS